jgi:Cu(I)/Ag(I) efflux system membrane protein CusA/SilA
MTETIVKLKPRSAWRPGLTLEQLRSEMSKAVELPGVSTIWTMPIVNRIDMLTTGIRSEVGVKIFGSELATLEGLGRQIAEVLRNIPGAANVYPEPVTSGQYLNIRIDRAAAARYGLSVGRGSGRHRTSHRRDRGRVDDRGPEAVSHSGAIRGGQPLDLQSIGNATVFGPGGQQIPLRAVATLESARGPAMISSENGLVVATVLLNVQGRDVGGFIDAARRAVAARVSLPPGYYLGWSGRYENQEHARRRLMLVFPLALVVIFVLLYFTYHSAAEAAHVLLAVPFALTGGVFLVWALGYNFSVAVWVGFHRAVWHCGADRSGHGHLSRGSRRPPAAGRRWNAYQAVTARSGHRRRTSSTAPEAHDRIDRGRRPAADHVEHARRRRSHEADCGARSWRHGVVSRACAPGDAGHLLLAAGAVVGSTARRAQRAC